MLNKRGQAEDGIETVVAIIGIIIGIVFLYVAQSAYTFSIDSAKDTLSFETSEINSIDSKFIEIDLLNLMKLPINDKYTFGEIISQLPENYPEITNPDFSNGILVETDYGTDSVLVCDTDMYNKLKEYFSPIYGDQIPVISVVDNSYRSIFLCPLLYYDALASGNMTLPSSDPDNSLYVIMEVPR